jgi:5-methylcytosine-specific restriction endonuclease McrA
MMASRDRRQQRRHLLRKQGGRCHWCGFPVVEVPTGGEPFRDTSPPGTRWATTDHVIPRSLGGSSTVTNVVVACHLCNAARTNRTDTYMPADAEDEAA